MIQDIFKKQEPVAIGELEKLGFLNGKKAYIDLQALSKTPLFSVLEELLKLSLNSPSPDDALANAEKIIGQLKPDSIKKFLAKKERLGHLVYICASAPYLSAILGQNPDWFEGLFLDGRLKAKKDIDDFKREFSVFIRGSDSFDETSRALRVYRNKEYIRIGARDLLGFSKMTETVAELSDLASALLDAGFGFCLKELKKIHGTPLYEENGKKIEAEFAVIGLGKLGGRELNFLSDIDIIYVYSSDKGETQGVDGKGGISLHAFFAKLSEKLTKLMTEPTGEGFVFRVDLGLRPEGKSGDICNSLRSAELYYESWGQMWERGAMIKARPVAGSRELGEKFIKMITPFTYRKYLDFTSIEEIKIMKEKIDRAKNQGALTDVKLGRGGIREIEFFCQTLGLIYGGKDPYLRENNTMMAIDKLTDKGFINSKDAETLKSGYVFLRNLEHRLQIVEGRQTHALPLKAEELKRTAKMMGFGCAEEFIKEYEEKTDAVHAIYRGLFYKSEGPLDAGLGEAGSGIFIALSQDASEGEILPVLSGLGFRDPETALKNIRLIRYGPPFLHLSQRARVMLEKLSPLLLKKMTESVDPDMALANMERFISAIGARTGLLALLYENQSLIEKLTTVFAWSAFLSNSLIEHPESLDIFLSEELAKPRKDKEKLLKEMTGVIKGATDYEETLDGLRRYKFQEFFRIGMNDMLSALSAGEVSAEITAMADCALESAYSMAVKELKKKYGLPGDERFFILAVGRLGARELIYGSDLDIVFVYNDIADKGHPKTQETTGPKVISDHEYFVLLAQKIIAILTLRTKEGIMFSVDTRLRPSGASGPLVVSKSSLLNYHREKSAIWERQAAIKARFAAGDNAFGESVLKELADIIYLKPLSKEDILEILRIRERMETEIARESEKRFDIKTGRGGITDIESIAQALQLRYGGKNPAIRTPSTIEALDLFLYPGAGVTPARFLDSEIMDKNTCAFLKEAYSFYRLMETRLRIVYDSPASVLIPDADAIKTLAKKMGYAGHEKLMEEYLNKSAKVRGIFLEIMERLKEGTV